MIFYILLCVFAVSTANAHSGRTNSEGCHNNRKTGGYHCHNGGSVAPAKKIFKKKKFNKSKPKSKKSRSRRSMLAGQKKVKAYNRKLYAHWRDSDKDCQNTRQEVLIMESRGLVELDEQGCKVISGKWYDPYTNSYFSDPSDLDIDHLVPLKEAHVSGASEWDENQKAKFANDIQNEYALIAVSSKANRQKGSRDPASWLPPNKAYHCQYIAQWKNVKQKWNLKMDAKEQQSIEKISAKCAQERALASEE